jgi:ABC-type amino acid transport system permease subunit
VERVASRPRAAEYLEALSEAFRRWLLRFIARHGDLWEGVSWSLRILAWVLVGAAILLLVLAIVRLARRRKRVAAPVAAAVPGGSSTPLPLDAAGWRLRVERRLAAGQIEGALEALWWWFATSIAREVDPSWTSRELLLAARRSDLATAAIELDRAIYGSHRPAAPEVSGLASRLEESIA